MPLDAAGRQRQHRIRTIERLNCGLFIDGKHGRVIRRIEVEPNHVGGFRFKIGIVGCMYRLEAVRLQTARRHAFATKL